MSNIVMNAKDKALMEKHGITSAEKTEYFYKDYKYGDLKSAINYAEHEAKKLAQESVTVTDQ